MRKLLLLIIFLLLSISIYSQEKIVMVTEDLDSYIVDFLIEAHDRGLDPLPEIMKLDSIITVVNMPGYLGVYRNNSIYINHFVLNDYVMARTVIFHELFHAVYKLEHCHDEGYDLMCAIRPNVFTFAYYYNEVVWQQVLDVEFDRVIKGQ